MGLARRSLVTPCYLFIYLSLFANVVHPEDIPGLCWGWTLATNERNQRQHKQMERYSMFLGGKNQYCENDYTTKYSIYRFNAIPIKLSMTFFIELEQKNSQFMWKHKRPWIAKAVLRKKNGAGGINHPDFRIYYKTTVIKTVWYWNKNRNIEQWKYRAKPRDKSTPYGYLIFNKACQNIQCLEKR